jgi:mono/diheme cytochrome c family protein
MQAVARLLLILAAAAVAAVALMRSPRLTPEERGRRLAERAGCFACHGAEGRDGAANPGRADRTVPGFGDAVMMYAKTEQDLREWIRDGVTRRRSQSQSWRADRDRGTLRMPAFGRRLSPGEIDDLVAFVAARAGMAEPADSLAGAGLERSHALGCTGCHGAGGRFTRPNPGSLRGVVPAWSGSDFPELVRDRAEFEQWVKRGCSDRFAANPLARSFLRRATLHMPAYERQLAPGDLDALWAYVQWLRSPAAVRAAATVSPAAE